MGVIVSVRPRRLIFRLRTIYRQPTATNKPIRNVIRCNLSKLPLRSQHLFDGGQRVDAAEADKTRV